MACRTIQSIFLRIRLIPDRFYGLNLVCGAFLILLFVACGGDHEDNQTVEPDPIVEEYGLILNDFQVIHKVNKNFKITMQYSSFHDSDPPMLAEKTDESISTMFSYNLN